MGRPRRGERRIDAAIDSLSKYGFPKQDIRRTINDLLQLYGKDGWAFLEEGSYRVVLDKLLEEQEQAQQQPQQKGGAENEMQISEVHNNTPVEAESTVEQVELPAMPNEPPALEHILPLPAATGTVRARPPCYGWISESESESDNEELFSGPRHEVNVPSPGGGLHCKRKRPSRWDVPPANW